MQRDDDTAMVDVDQVVVARTSWREFQLEWPGVDLILRLLKPAWRRSPTDRRNQKSGRDG